MNKVLKTVGTLAIVGLIGAATAVGLAYVYEDEIIAGIRQAIDSHIDTRVSVSDISFSLVDRFPKASIRLQDPWIEDKLTAGDTLLAAKNIYLEFDILQLMTEEYLIERIAVEQGVIHLRADVDGEVNYVFWKENTQGKGSVDFEIDELLVEEVTLTLDHAPSEVTLATAIDGLALGMVITGDEVAISLESEQGIEQLTISGKEYMGDRRTALSGSLRYLMSSTDLHLDDFMVTIDGIALPLHGSITALQDGRAVDLKSKGSVALEDLMAILPEEEQASMSAYRPEGEVAYDMLIKGASTAESSPKVRIAFNSSQARITERSSGIVLDRLASAGVFETLDSGSERLTLSRLTAELGGSQLSISGALDHFDSPWVNADVNFSGDVSEVTDFFNLGEVISGTGTLALKAHVKGPLPTSEDELNKLSRLDMDGECTIEGVDLTFSDGHQHLDGIDGQITLKNNDLIVDRVEGLMNGSQFEFEGRVANFISYLASDTEELAIEATFHSPEVILDDWMSESDGEGDERHFGLSHDIRFDLAIEIERLVYASFTAEGIKGRCRSAKGVFEAKPLTFSSASGSVEADLKISDIGEGRFSVSSHTSLSGIDIAEVFDQFDQFGQDYLTSAHLRGRADAEIDYSCRFDQGLEVESESIVSTADLHLSDGQLIAHSSMVDIIGAMRERKMLRPFVRIEDLEKEMRHLHFKDLDNTIRIANGRIDIPEMLISTNAMDLTISGRHGFDDMVDYRFNFRLRDILVNSQNPEFLVEDDGLGHRIYLRMHGQVDDPEIEMDKGSAKESRKEAIAEAGSDIKSFFKDPFRAAKDKEGTKAIVTVIDEGDEEGSTPISKESKVTDEKDKGMSKDKKKARLIIDVEEEEELFDDDDF